MKEEEKALMKVMLVFPRTRYVSGDPPLGIAYLAASIREKTDWDVRIFDFTFNRSFAAYQKALSVVKPEVVGIYVDTPMYHDAMNAARKARNLGCFVVAGGPHTTVLPDTVMEQVDLAIIGEAESAFVDILKRYSQKDFSGIGGIWFWNKSKIMKNPRKPSYQDIDRIPFPARDLLDMENYIKNWHLLDGISPSLRGTNLISSRGCPFNCSYCQPTLRKLFGDKVRTRNPENVIEEIKRIKKLYRLDAIFFHDDTFTYNRKWIKSLCDSMIKDDLNLIWGCNSRIDTVDVPTLRLMKKAGCRILHVGIESGSPRILEKVYSKGITVKEVKQFVEMCNRAGIHVLGFFMLGAPTETEEEIKRTIKFACSLKIGEASFSITTPLPGTRLYDAMIGKNYVLKKDFAHYDYYKERAFSDRQITKKKLRNYQRLALLLFYLHPYRWRFILKHLRSITGIRKMILKISRFF